MTKLLYVSHNLVAQCGVRDFGRRHFNALIGSDVYDIILAEVGSLEEYLAQLELINPDIVLFNYMPIVMPWVSSPQVLGHRAIRVAVQHLYADKTIPAIMKSQGIFQAMVCLDPSSAVKHDRVYVMSRPIPASVENAMLSDVLKIGSFGFGMGHKRFPLIAREVNRCFDEAVFNLHMTTGDFSGDYSAGILEACRAEITKPGIVLNHTSNYLDETEVVRLLNGNHINALFYELEQESPGLSSSLDYLIAARRPALLSDCALFRHIPGPRFPQTDFIAIMGAYETATVSAELLYVEQSGKLRAETEKMVKELLS